MHPACVHAATAKLHSARCSASAPSLPVQPHVSCAPTPVRSRMTPAPVGTAWRGRLEGRPEAEGGGELRRFAGGAGRSSGPRPADAPVVMRTWSEDVTVAMRTWCEDVPVAMRTWCEDVSVVMRTRPGERVPWRSGAKLARRFLEGGESLY